MTWHNDLHATEWAVLGNAPMAAGAAVALASAGGGRSEAQALVTSWREAGQHFAESDLVATLVARFDPERPNSGGAGYLYPTILDEAVGLCSQAVAFLRRVATHAEVDAYRAFVMDVAEGVATAHREGGLFGLGGDTVSPEERVVLGAVARALGYRTEESSL